MKLLTFTEDLQFLRGSSETYFRQKNMYITARYER